MGAEQAPARNHRWMSHHLVGTRKPSPRDIAPECLTNPTLNLGITLSSTSPIFINPTVNRELRNFEPK